MADLEHLMRAVGGDRGTTVVATSLIFTITSWVSVFLAEAYADKGNIYMITKIEHRDRKVIFEFLCYSSIALCVAMVIEHIHILIIVGPRTILSRHIPPSIRGRLTFYLILTSYWISFAGGQACLIIAMINLWHGRVLKIFTYVYVFMFLVVLFTMLLHVRANSIRWRLLDITWIDGFTSIVQSQNVEDCVICLETHSVGESMRSLPCGHKFHQVGNIYMITKIEHRDRKVIFEFLCYSSIALCVAMVIEHIYILIIVGPRTILSRHIPPSIRGRLTFYLILTSYWHGKQPQRM